MKEEILKRAMFAMPLSKESRNAGIMSGFDMEEMQDDVDTNADMEDMPPMARTPQNPEILMNTLRGDMRSVDARYMELAQMVGEEAAMETPPEVLAMLMGQMGAQQGGIGALPQGQAMAPPGAQAPAPDQMGAQQPAPAMPQGGIPMPEGMESAPPFSQGAEAPQGYAYGGEVEASPQYQNFGGAGGGFGGGGGGGANGSGMLNLQVPISVGGSSGGQLGQLNNSGFGGNSGMLGGLFGGASEQPSENPFSRSILQQMREQQMGGDSAAGTETYDQYVAGRGPLQQDIAPSAEQFESAAKQLAAMLSGQKPATPGMGMQNPGLFADGGEVAAPQGYAIGGLVRGAQLVGDKVGQLGSAANAALGRMFMTPQGISQPYLENLRGPGGKFTAEQVQRGGNLIQPTFTQGLQEGVTRLAEQYPRAAQLALPAAAAVGLYNAPKGGSQQSMGSDMASQIPGGTAADMVKNSVLNQPPAVSMSLDKPFTVADPSRYKINEGMPASAPVSSPAAPAMEKEAPAAAPAEDDLGAFISDKLSAFDKRQEDKGSTLAKDLKAAVGEKSKMDRIRDAQKEYAPLYEELLGSDKESAKVNALLLLSEAGLKLAGTRKPTFAMALADAASGLPKGFAAIAAQERELGMKVKAASLQQAIGDVDAQDKYAQALKLQIIKGDYDLLKEQAKQGGGVTEDGGMGLRVTKTKGGTFLGTGIDPNDPSVKSAVQSRFTLRDTDNPFVENRGQAPTTIETDKGERVKLGTTLRSLDNSLSTLDNLKGVYTSAYGPGAWFSDKVNNLLVPVDPTGLVKPNFDVADASTRISTGMNSVLKNIASANDGGRVAVQEQEWARETAKGISDPTKFFADKELAAKQFASMEAMLRNARQQVLTQLGYEGNDYVMNTPNTGTKNDPFRIPADPAQQRTMFTFLGSTIGKLQDPRAVVYLQMPNGKVDAFNPTQLRALNQ